MEKEKDRGSFGSKLGVILATAGSAVGLGNVWRFPYMAGENGGAAFILIYLICVLLLGIPCMVSEFIIGRRGGTNASRVFAKVAQQSGRKSLFGAHLFPKFIGYMGILTGLLIISYYAVVSGWCLQYIYASAAGELSGDVNYVTKYFEDFSASATMPVVWTVAILVMSHLIICRGVRGGIEKAAKLMMPLLFILLLMLVGASCLLPGASKGIAFLLHPDFSSIDGNVFLGALGQAFYSLSIGMGALCTYASYFNSKTNLVTSAVQISLVDSFVAILAGLMIFPAAFSVGVNPGSGPSLVFITLPNVFSQAFASMPAVGWAVALLFYVLLSLAALTSLMSLHEVLTAFCVEELHVSRNRGTLMVTIAACVIGAFCSLSLGAADISIAGRSLFDIFDFVTGQILLPVGGFLTCLFLGWGVSKRLVREEFFTGYTPLRAATGQLVFNIFLFLIRVVCPIAIAAIFLHQFGVI